VNNKQQQKKWYNKWQDQRHKRTHTHTHAGALEKRFAEIVVAAANWNRDILHNASTHFVLLFFRPSVCVCGCCVCVVCVTFAKEKSIATDVDICLPLFM